MSLVCTYECYVAHLVGMGLLAVAAVSRLWQEGANRRHCHAGGHVKTPHRPMDRPLCGRLSGVSRRQSACIRADGQQSHRQSRSSACRLCASKSAAALGLRSHRSCRQLICWVWRRSPGAAVAPLPCQQTKIGSILVCVSSPLWRRRRKKKAPAVAMSVACVALSWRLFSFDFSFLFFFYVNLLFFSSPGAHSMGSESLFSFLCVFAHANIFFVLLKTGGPARCAVARDGERLGKKKVCKQGAGRQGEMGSVAFLCNRPQWGKT